MDLFDFVKRDGFEPLAYRMRPRTLNEFVGQKHIVSEDKLLYKMIKGDKLFSLIFYGPPGTGKTTLAEIIANSTKSHFEKMNAITAGVPEIKKTVQEARDRLNLYNKRTILFIDEIHRFNKLQQEALLPYIEDGTVILIGATTENPFYEIVGPLISRCIILKLEPLDRNDIKEILHRAVSDKRGLGNFNVSLEEKAAEYISTLSNGDARFALNILELAFLMASSVKEKIRIDIDVVKECIKNKKLLYDKNRDNHYDTISAFIKSMRGSDPDATLFWMAKMLASGEDPHFIARRIIICAAEDVGNADPMALNVAVSAAKALEMIGMPEGRLILAQAALYVACAPKSNSTIKAIERANKDIQNALNLEVPEHLKNSSDKYLYPHDFPGNYVKQSYWPEGENKRIYYEPSENGYEKIIKERMENLNNR